MTMLLPTAGRLQLFLLPIVAVLVAHCRGTTKLHPNQHGQLNTSFTALDSTPTTDQENRLNVVDLNALKVPRQESQTGINLSSTKGVEISQAGDDSIEKNEGSSFLSNYDQARRESRYRRSRRGWIMPKPSSEKDKRLDPSWATPLTNVDTHSLLHENQLITFGGDGYDGNAYGAGNYGYNVYELDTHGGGNYRKDKDYDEGGNKRIGGAIAALGLKIPFHAPAIIALGIIVAAAIFRPATVVGPPGPTGPQGIQGVQGPAGKRRKRRSAFGGVNLMTGDWVNQEINDMPVDEDSLLSNLQSAYRRLG